MLYKLKMKQHAVHATSMAVRASLVSLEVIRRKSEKSEFLSRNHRHLSQKKNFFGQQWEQASPDEKEQRGRKTLKYVRAGSH